jgi:hypothetical protein
MVRTSATTLFHSQKKDQVAYPVYMTIRWKTREDVQHFDDNIQYVIQ